jgi:threonine dehydrogenase-like Zn-dependent dehydrogenase
VVKAIAVFPEQREVRLLDHPEPELRGPHDVLVRTIETGVCGTDREICEFLYGSPPPGERHLILGHEAIGEVVAVGSDVQGLCPGDLVVPSVRRPCPHPCCEPCRAGRQDYCATGDFSERGIKERHGYMTEAFVEEERHLYLVPPGLRDLAVLTEPLTVGEKALSQVWQVQRRLPWGADAGSGEGKTALVLGAGPVGLLGAMLLVARGFRTFVYSRSPAPNPKAAIAEAVGARYISSQKLPPEALAGVTGPIDLVYEAVGAADISFAVMAQLAPNGVFVFTGIPPELPAIPVAADSLMRRVVLGNQAIIGTVNADPAAFHAALQDIALFGRRWPEAVRGMITGRHAPERYREVLVGPRAGIKNLIAFAHQAM